MLLNQTFCLKQPQIRCHAHDLDRLNLTPISQCGYTGGVKPQPSYSMASEARACLADVSRLSGSKAGLHQNNSQIHEGIIE
jgi:hypothetical protein